MLRQCYETSMSAKAVAASMRNGDVVPLSLALSHTIGLKPFEPLLQQLSQLFPGLQLKLLRGSRNEVIDYMKCGAAEMAIAGPLGEVWPPLEALPMFDQACEVGAAPNHRLATRPHVDFADLISETMVIDTSCELTEEFRARCESERDPRVRNTLRHEARGPTSLDKGESRRRHCHRIRRKNACA